MPRVYAVFVETHASADARGSRSRGAVSAYIDVPDSLSLRQQQRYIRQELTDVLTGESPNSSESGEGGKPTDPSVYRSVVHGV